MKNSSLFLLLTASSIYASHSSTQERPDTLPSTTPNPVGRFIAKNGVHLFVKGEALLFQIAQDDLPIAQYTNVYPSPPENPQAELEHYKHQWKWGYRITAGYQLDHDGWDIVASYTRFYAARQQTYKNERLPLKLYSQAQLNQGTTPTDDSFVYFYQSVKFNQWDVEQARMFYVSKFLRFRPLLGLRNVLLGQAFNTYYIEQELPRKHFKDTNNVHFWGMGPLAGVDMFWNMNYQFNLYGTAKVSTLFGFFQPSLSDQSYSTAGTTTVTVSQQKASKSCLDLAIGFQWDKNFYNEKLHIGCNVGFETHTFFNMNKSTYSYPIATQLEGISGRDFTLQGFTFGVRADF